MHECSYNDPWAASSEQQLSLQIVPLVKEEFYAVLKLMGVHV
jgi:hypothetical protein